MSWQRTVISSSYLSLRGWFIPISIPIEALKPPARCFRDAKIRRTPVKIFVFHALAIPVSRNFLSGSIVRIILVSIEYSGQHQTTRFQNYICKIHAKRKSHRVLWRMRHGSRTRTENTNTNGVTRKRFRCETRPRETTEKEKREVRKVAPVLIRDMDALMRERTVFVIIKIRVRFSQNTNTFGRL